MQESISDILKNSLEIIEKDGIDNQPMYKEAKISASSMLLNEKRKKRQLEEEVVQFAPFERKRITQESAFIDQICSSVVETGKYWNGAASLTAKPKSSKLLKNISHPMHMNLSKNSKSKLKIKGEEYSDRFKNKISMKQKKLNRLSKLKK
jgi:hypothetical protein